MNQYEDFLFSLYYAKLEVPEIKSGNIPTPWNGAIKRSISTLSSKHEDLEIEAHVIALKNYFKERIDYPQIISAIKQSLKQRDNQNNKHFFARSVFTILYQMLKTN
jgi:hypothetical protein